MAETFDPYHKWLGISPVEQPANHYRLLGLRDFESDPDVIESAADRQMAHVQTQKTGPHSALSQKLLNELAAARLCLLDPARKTAYDQSLRVTLAERASIGPAAMVDVQPGHPGIAQAVAPIATAAAVAPPIAVVSGRKPVIAPRRRNSQRWLVPGLSLVVTIVLLAAAFYFLRSGTATRAPVRQQPVAQQPSSPVNAPPAMPPGASGAPSTLNNSTTSALPAKSDLAAAAGSAATERPPHNPAQPATSTDLTATSITTSLSNSAESPMPSVAETAAESASNPGRPKPLPPPTGEALTAAKAAVNTMFESEITAAKTALEQHAVARRMFDRSFAPDLAADVSHQLLERAAEVAAAAGRYDVACEAIETMAGRFDTDTVKMKKAALEASDRFAKSASELRTLVDSWVDLAAEATAADQYAAAVECYDQAVVVARKTSDRTLVTRTVESAKDAATILAAFDEAVAARDRLATHPGDPEAAAAWGRFLCLYKNDWDSGLAIWSRGLDEMAHTARQDVARPPFSTEQTALADRWWDSAEQATEELSKKRLRVRAAYWYRYARLGAARGELARIQQRIDLVEQSTADFPTGQWIDLLKTIDLSKHRVQGQWESNGNVLAAPGRGDHRLLVPITANGSYELEASLTLGPKDGPEVNFIFPVGSQSCSLILFGWDGKTSGLHSIDGKHADNNETTIRKVGPQRGQRFKVSIEVEMASEEAKVEVKLNSRAFTRWQGSASRLDLGKFMKLPQPNAFGVRSLNAPVILHTLRLRVHSGVAKAIE